MKCSVEGCERQHRSNGYCLAHYQRWVKTGDPGPATVRERIWKIDPNAECSVDGCDGKVEKKGLCGKHYQRKKAYGSPTGQPAPRVKPTIQDVLSRHIKKGSDDECWEWQASLNPKGYGKTDRVATGEQLAHRAAYRAWVGDIPDGLWVLHTCDNPRCCNPSHLFLGDVKANVLDMTLKGRGLPGGRPRRLTDEDVRRIRDRNFSISDLMEEFGISRQMIGLIRSRKCYAYIE